MALSHYWIGNVGTDCIKLDIGNLNMFPQVEGPYEPRRAHFQQG